MPPLEPFVVSPKNAASRNHQHKQTAPRSRRQARATAVPNTAHQPRQSQHRQHCPNHTVTSTYSQSSMPCQHQHRHPSSMRTTSRPTWKHASSPSTPSPTATSMSNTNIYHQHQHLSSTKTISMHSSTATPGQVGNSVHYQQPYQASTARV